MIRVLAVVTAILSLISASSLCNAGEYRQLQQVPAQGGTGTMTAPAQGGTGMMVPAAQPEPQVRAVSPAALTQGGGYTLQLIGANLLPGLSIDFGQGVQVVGTPSFNGSIGTLNVQIAPDAPVGPHEIKLTLNGKTTTALPKLIINPAPPTMQKIMPLAAAPAGIRGVEASVFAVSPNNWTPGKSYEVTITGLGFAEGMEIRFGNGVEVKDMTVSGPTSAKVEVEVSKGAQPGVRVAELRRSAETPWKSTSATVWVVKAKKPAQAAIPQIGFKKPDLVAFQKGVISLSSPMWGDFESVEVKPDYGIPQVNDKTVFEWKEKNPGTADWFEFRLMRPSGEVLLTKKVTDTYYRPDPEFIKELWDILRPSGAQAVQQSGTGSVQDVVVKTQTFGGGQGQEQQAPTKQEKYLKDHWQEIGLYWEVAGYKTYKENVSGGKAGGQSGQQSSLGQQGQGQAVFLTSQNIVIQGAQTVQTKDVEVEISERWPLSNKTRKPTGMACGAGTGTLAIQKASGDPADLVKHPMDLVELFGNFNLGGCPWNVSVQNMYDYNTQVLIDVKSYNFNNVFVDWGDGTVEPLSSSPEDKHSYYDGKTLSVDMFHKYKWVDQFTVRVYVLPEDDLGMLDDIVDANAKKDPLYEILGRMSVSASSGGGAVYAGPDGEGMSGTLLAALDTPLSDAGGSLFAASGVQHAAPSIGGQSTPGGSSGGKSFSPSQSSPQITGVNAAAPPVLGAMDRAFLAYCNQVDIQPVMDTDATGPLHLDWINVKSFSGQPEAAKAGALSLSPPGKAKASAKSGLAVLAGPPKSEVSPVGKALSGSEESGSGTAGQLSFTGGTMKDLAATENAAAKAGFNIPYDARATTCDEGLIATAELSYYGKGRVRVTWDVDGVGFSDEYDLASEPRNGLPSDKSKWGEPKRSVVSVNSPLLPVNKAGFHDITVEAQVIPRNSTDKIDAQTLMGILGGGSSSGKADQKGRQQSTIQPGGAKPEAAAQTQAGGSGPKFGVISNMNVVAADKPPVTYVSQGSSAMPNVVIKLPPWYVKSDGKRYLVVQPDPEYPCVFHFPVAGGGYFRVTSLQGNVKKDASGKWTGKGTLLFKLPADQTSYKTYYKDIQINGWEVEGDVDVKSGEINLADLGISIDALPGMKAKLDKLAAKPGMDMAATMDVTVGSPELKLVDTNAPKTWQALSSTLSPRGDWYKSGLKLGETYIGWSLCKVSSDDVRVDLSQSEGDSPGGSQHSWVGIHLGQQAKFYPYVMDLQNIPKPVSGWAISGGGLSGKASIGPYDHAMGEGSVHFDSITADVKDNNVDAAYNGVKIHMPWPDITLESGQAHLAYGPQGASVKFDFSNAGAFTLKYGQIDMTVNNVEFKKGKSSWGLGADTTFDYYDSGNNFASVLVDGLFFDMMGFASFEDGQPSHSIGLSGKSKLGKAPLDLKSVSVTPSSAGSGERLVFAVITDLSLSKTLSKKQVQVNYQIKRTSGNYYSVGPYVSPFDVYVEYPAVNPVTRCKIAPELSQYGASAGNAMYASLYGPGDGGVLSDAYRPVLMASAGSYTDTFVGSVDTAMFGMSDSIKATFRLGYVGDDDYWITYASMSPHLLIFPGVELQTIGGGLGYNFAKDAYTTDPATAVPVINNSMLYSADLTVGSPDGFAYRVHGVLTIIPGQGLYRMDFLNVKLLGMDNIGQGYFQYGDGHFEGAVWGGLSLYGGLVSLTIPQGSTGLYFSSDRWEVKAGGHGHLIILDTDVSMALGSEVGLAMSGGFHAGTGKICLGVISGSFSVNGNLGFQVTPSAHLHTEARIHASCSVCAACYKPCASLGAGVDLHIDLPPLKMKLCVDLDCPWPIPDYSGCFGI